MDASQAKTGSRHISRTGIPITVIGNKNGKVSLKLDTTGSVIRVNSDYELKPADGHDSAHNGKTRSKTAGEVYSGTHKSISLASIIDPFLFAGRHTVKDIAAELGKRAAAVVRGKDLEANVRARMVSYSRKGWQVLKDGNKHVHIVQGCPPGQ